MKKCYKCKNIKPYSEFNKNKSTKDGFENKCKACKKEYAQANRDRINKYNREYRYKSPEYHQKCKNYSLKWTKENYTHKLEKNREYYQNNKEKICKRTREYQKKNPERRRNYARNRNDRIANLDVNFTLSDAILVKQKFKYKCFKCGTKKYFCIDHHYPLKKGFGLSLINAGALCRGCNASKSDKFPEEFYTRGELIVLHSMGIQDLSDELIRFDSWSKEERQNNDIY